MTHTDTGSGTSVPPAAASAPVVEVLGVRHHGPGSARSVVAALHRLQPDVVLVEGPADADPLLALAGSPDMVPPVALFAYAVDDAHVAAFWPFAVFSPEWQALRWAAGAGVPVRFCDLPTGQVLADRPARAPGSAPAPAPGSPRGSAPASGSAPAPAPGSAPATQPGRGRARRDPLALLAEAAGYDDPERWWDDVVESRTDGSGLFDALTEAMTDLRLAADLEDPATAAREARREAHMRQTLRAVLKGGAQRVAVVCGAWHAPALTGPLPSAAADAKLLRGAATRKTALTWVPWTHTRLATASGYGAGITSPGWYHHLFTAPDQPVTRWLTKVGRSLRDHDLPVSSAHIIEAVRLADALAALRGRPLAGLSEVTDATRSVLCDGDELPLQLVTRDLVVGEAMGAVPADAPTVPLEADLRAHARRLRLKIDPLAKDVTLDLRRDNDVARSRLLQRLQILGIGWAQRTEDTTGRQGTFAETWTLQWTPDLVIALVEASVWGATVDAAATARLLDTAVTATRLAQLTAAVGQALRADLPAVLDAVLAALADRAATDHDVTHLMDALPSLVRALQYGDVRGTDTAALGAVADTLLVRICTGLPGAVVGLTDEAAAAVRSVIDDVHAAVLLRGDADDVGRTRWLATLTTLAARDTVHGLIAGRMTRLLLDTATITAADAARALSRALSVGPSAATKAGWAEGFLSGSALLLVHDTALLTILDAWIASLDPREFLDVLPLLRRTFGAFADPERRTIGQQIRGLGSAPAVAAAEFDIDLDLAGPVLATVARLLAGTR